MTDTELIILIGFKGSGKSTVGRILADKLGASFADTDYVLQELYEERTGEKCSFREIFKKRGREYFNALEIDALKRVLDQKGRVISFGGGTLLVAPKTNFDFSKAFYVNIGVEKDVLFERIMSDGLPAFFDPDDPRGSFDEYFEIRAEVYDQYADMTVDNTYRTPDEVATEIANVVLAGV